ncbi:8270_t:CDS:1, partial [Paraglomus brasilianum]
SDFQRLLKSSAGKAAALACVFWEMADAVLKEHYTDIYKKLADEKPPKWEFKLFIPRKRQKKLKGFSSPASAKILPSAQHLGKKDTTDPCPSTPSVALPDNQPELDLNCTSNNIYTEILPSAQHLNNEYTIDPSTPPDADRRLPDHQPDIQQLHDYFEFYEGPILFPCAQEWLWNSPPVIVPIPLIPLTHNNCSNYEVTSSYPTVEYGNELDCLSEYYALLCLDEKFEFSERDGILKNEKG